MIHTIEVKQEHINKGIRYQCYECPVALALRDSGFNYVHVSYFSVRVNEEYVPLPKVVQSKIIGFDAGEPVSPFAFQIELP